MWANATRMWPQNILSSYYAHIWLCETKRQKMLAQQICFVTLTYNFGEVQAVFTRNIRTTLQFTILIINFELLYFTPVMCLKPGRGANSVDSYQTPLCGAWSESTLFARIFRVNMVVQDVIVLKQWHTTLYKQTNLTYGWHFYIQEIIKMYYF